MDCRLTKKTLMEHERHEPVGGIQSETRNHRQNIQIKDPNRLRHGIVLDPISPFLVTSVGYRQMTTKVEHLKISC